MEKELNRIHTAKERLARVNLLSLPTNKVYQVILAACLSLVDYAGLPSLSHHAALATPIKKALGANFRSS